MGRMIFVSSNRDGLMYPLGHGVNAEIPEATHRPDAAADPAPFGCGGAERGGPAGAAGDGAEPDFDAAFAAQGGRAGDGRAQREAQFLSFRDGAGPAEAGEGGSQG